MLDRPPLRQALADVAARLALRLPLAERLLRAGTRRPAIRRALRLGAIALGYPRVLQRRELRIADMNGYCFQVNVGESLGVGPYFFGDSGTTWFTRSLIRPGDACVDAGANAGHYTFLCASLVGPQGRVFAFEPNPEFAALIRQSITLNGFDAFVLLSTNALWSASGEIKTFYVSVEPMNTGTSSLVNHGLFLSREHTIEVRTITLDDFAEKAGIEHFRLVKIDVERAEDALLEGASRVLSEQRIDYLIIEMYAGGRAQALMTSAGYEGHFVDSERRRLLPLASIANGLFGDYLFVRPGLSGPPAQ
jgi:FkbM family methyltransferase